jgi:putative MFS transporter
MGSTKRFIDDAPFGPFHRRLAVYSCGGPFCDGYILGIIAIALTPLSRDLALGASWQGLIGAATLVGMFIGGGLFGYLTDRIGRQVMYTLDLMVLVFASAAQFWVESGWQLFALRFVLGLAVGADYPIATALLTEFAPKRQRGMLLSAMIGSWWFGYTASFIIGYAISDSGGSTWRWMLASSAVPAAFVALMRFGTPESPRWLVSKGRIKEAREVIQKHLGSGYDIEEAASPATTQWRSIFRGEYGRRTLFVAVFWTCHTIPSFAIYTFAPQLLQALGATNPSLGAAIMSVFFLVGVLPAILLIDRIGRRPVLIAPFFVCALMMGCLVVIPKASTTWIAVCFIIYAIFSAGSSVLEWVYPSELFPTDVRASAMGFATSISRFGAAVGTFLFPIGLVSLGVNSLMVIAGLICVFGGVVSLIWAPETRGMSLGEASGARAVGG